MFDSRSLRRKLGNFIPVEVSPVQVQVQVLASPTSVYVARERLNSVVERPAVTAECTHCRMGYAQDCACGRTGGSTRWEFA